MIFTCPVCEKEVEVPEPFGDNVICPNCKAELETEYEESYDESTGDESYWSWVTGVAKGA